MSTPRKTTSRRAISEDIAVPRKARESALRSLSAEARRELIARGSTEEPLARIIAWLKQEHGVKISDSRLSEFLKKSRALALNSSRTIAGLLLEGCERLAAHAPHEAMKLQAACFSALVRAGVAFEAGGGSPGEVKASAAARRAQGKGNQ